MPHKNLTPDRAFAFAFDHSGLQDHITLYRPETNTLWILRHDGGGQFRAVYARGDPGKGIGGYDLKDPADEMFAYDADGSGELDALALYRPGKQLFLVVQHYEDGNWLAPHQSSKGVGGFDPKRKADRCFPLNVGGEGGGIGWARFGLVGGNFK